MEYSVHTISKEDLPKQLLEIPQPPKALSYVGVLPPKEHIYLTIVGSRKFTRYGKDACEALIAGLKGYPITIVSGLALGIDTIVHEVALKHEINTIAFPGSGLHPTVLYPRSNYALAQKIVDNGGCLISEFPEMTRAALWTFPSRNRLMAGISKAVLIIEAEEKSGTLITARMALDYNRDVLVVPGSIFSPSSKGTHMLLKHGATPIASSDDILEALGFEKRSELEVPEYADITPEEQQMLELLFEPQPRDELVRMSGKSAQEINTLLTVMELKGMIKEEYGEIRRY
jgi:DNA processing protein